MVLERGRELALCVALVVYQFWMTFFFMTYDPSLQDKNVNP
jgi:hypothetical protein